MHWDDTDQVLMKEALHEASEALTRKEVPIGCVIARNGRIFCRGSNRTNEARDGTRHAEMVAVDKVLSTCKDQQACQDAFKGCVLYVTCEPCIMCAAALSLLGVEKVVYGCGNERFGGNGSILKIHQTGCGSCTGDAGGQCGGIYRTSGGLFVEQAVNFLKEFYAVGNPNAPLPHRPLEKVSEPAVSIPD